MTHSKLEWISVEVDTHCNVRCTMCPIHDDKVHNQGRIQLQTIERITELARGWTDKICLAVMGEPLLHPQVTDMIRIINDAGFKSLLWTNGLLVNERRARGVLEAGLDKIVFSFEIVDKELHERIRKGAQYDKVRANLDRFLQLKSEIHPKTEVSIWNILPDRSRGLEIPDHIRDAYPGVEIYCSYAMDWHGEVKVETSQEELGDPAPCNQIQNYASIAWNGDVMACCNDFNHEYILGNVFEAKSFDEIWFGRRRFELIEKMTCGALADVKPCGTCSAPYVKRGVDRVFAKDAELFQGKAASNAAKQIDGRHAVS
ncbi:MAG: radical SAM protein [Rhodobacteraceae bacterium]|nr:radical SAM protein [Paracoccaceae bacterium]